MEATARVSLVSVHLGLCQDQGLTLKFKVAEQRADKMTKYV